LRKKVQLFLSYSKTKKKTNSVSNYEEKLFKMMIRKMMFLLSFSSFGIHSYSEREREREREKALNKSINSDFRLKVNLLFPSIHEMSHSLKYSFVSDWNSKQDIYMLGLIMMMMIIAKRGEQPTIYVGDSQLFPHVSWFHYRECQI
jgi:hypothetical protein